MQVLHIARRTVYDCEVGVVEGPQSLGVFFPLWDAAHLTVAVSASAAVAPAAAAAAAAATTAVT